jgi:hypothetical protein
MSENRRQILQMLADGKITADEAERLIAALEKEPSSASAEPVRGEVLKPRAKYLRVLVEAQDQHHGNGSTKVNIRVPMQLLRAGVRLGALMPREARDRANAAMREKGIDFDLSQIKPENLEELIEQLKDLEVNVDEDRAKVRVFCE